MAGINRVRLPQGRPYYRQTLNPQLPHAPHEGLADALTAGMVLHQRTVDRPGIPGALVIDALPEDLVIHKLLLFRNSEGC